ncbi:MAG TPA: GNAT family N-acetyltransferase [Rubrobacteraceae bacterium]|nr:GNAT family N-acetyltransferase [Rubrobacteraceae bacterium]
MDVRLAPASDLAEPLGLLERWLRSGDPVPEEFAERLGGEVEAGCLEFLVARIEGRVAGVAVLAYRLNVSAAGPFASVEDLYVVPDARRRGVGRALLEAVTERCAVRGVSYVEAQVESEEAIAFYDALGYEPELGVRTFSRSYAL